jgi:hypothetical protein
MQQFYVSVSRGKESVTIFTEDREALLKAVEKSGQRLSATELITPKPKSFEAEATFVSRLASTARDWATRQTRSLTNTLGIQRDAVSSDVGQRSRAAEVIAKYGRPYANQNTQSKLRERYRERER